MATHITISSLNKEDFDLSALRGKGNKQCKMIDQSISFSNLKTVWQRKTTEKRENTKEFIILLFCCGDMTYNKLGQGLAKKTQWVPTGSRLK